LQTLQESTEIVRLRGFGESWQGAAQQSWQISTFFLSKIAQATYFYAKRTPFFGR